jgi:type I restriction enzyme, S subunit
MAGELPEGWAAATLEDLLNPVGNILPMGHLDRIVTYIDISSVDNQSRIVFNPRSILASDLPSRGRRLVQPGDVLFATVRPYLRSIAMVPEISNPVASTGFCVLRPAAGVSGRFLYYLVQSDHFMARIIQKQRGVQYPAVKDSDVKSQFVSVPPSAEQVRIADRLDSVLGDLSTRVSELRTKIDAIGLLRTSEIDKAYEAASVGGAPRDGSDSATNDHVKPTIQSLGMVLLSASYGTSRKTSEEAAGDLVLRIPNIEQGQIKLEAKKYANQPLGINADNYLKSGDILVVRTSGSLQLVGRAAIVGKEIPPQTYFASYLIRLRANPEKVTPEWIERFLSTTIARETIAEGSSPTSGPHNVNLRVLRSIPIPVPSLAAQRIILGGLDVTLESIMTREVSMRSELERIEIERGQLINDGVVGKLILQHPEGESADVLLKQIMYQRKSQSSSNRSRHKTKNEKKTATKNAPNLPEVDMISILHSHADWMDTNNLFRIWASKRNDHVTLIDEFYSTVAKLIHQERVDVRSEYDAQGRKTGSQFRTCGDGGGRR